MKDLRFGLFLAPSLRGVYEAVAYAIGRRVGLSTEVVPEPSYENFGLDRYDVCFVCSLAYVSHEQVDGSPHVPIAAPIPAGSRYGRRPVYFSDVIVHRDSQFRSLLDLRGRSWAFNEPLSHSGYGVMRHHLVRIGEIDGFFDRVVESGAHEESIRMIRRGEVDGSAIDSHLLGVEMRNDPPLRDELRVIDVLGPSTIQPVTASRRLSRELLDEIRKALIEIHLDLRVRRELERGMIDRFVPVDAGSYDDIRLMTAACEQAEFMTLR